MKKRIIIFILIIIVLIPIFFFGYKMYQNYQEEMKIKNAKIVVDLKGNLKIRYDEEVKISDLIENINGKIIDDKVLDTKDLGKKTIEFKYINEEEITIPYTIEYEVVDNVPPIIWLNDTYSLKVGTKGDLETMIMSGDYYDDNPKREIIGEYDLNKIGNYKLTYRIVDKSGNETKKDFTLKVHNNPSNYKVNKKNFFDLKKKYKDDKTLIGLDVSKWQGNIDYSKVANSGIDFVMIKLGGTSGIGGEYYVDPKFKDNIEGFQEQGIEVGVYFYSYAKSIEEAKREAGFVLSQIKDYNISFPIAFDWENWSSFNKFNISFKTLSETANAFIETVEESGYIGLLYSSKNYLEKIWDTMDNPIWLAHYTDKTDYKGDYVMWQLTSGGVIPGITENTVDVDIMYLK
jgi:GH25 family lysozyme M1 (1,4-beta-N-acetylmuramidase)